MCIKYSSIFNYVVAVLTIYKIKFLVCYSPEMLIYLLGIIYVPIYTNDLSTAWNVIFVKLVFLKLQMWNIMQVRHVIVEVF